MTSFVRVWEGSLIGKPNCPRTCRQFSDGLGGVDAEPVCPDASEGNLSDKPSHLCSQIFINLTTPSAIYVSTVRLSLAEISVFLRHRLSKSSSAAARINRFTYRSVTGSCIRHANAGMDNFDEMYLVGLT